jgi:hypothetical protein
MAHALTIDIPYNRYHSNIQIYQRYRPTCVIQFRCCWPIIEVRIIYYPHSIEWVYKYYEHHSIRIF